MAVTDEPPIPQMVGNAFVEQYYSILHQTPHLVYRFYHESSVLSRPEEDGSMTMVTTIEGINNKIISLDHTRCRVEILSADAQPSYKDGVMVVVTGCLIGSDNLKRKFIQSFFLAPQDKVYFVLNDVFRYVDEYKLVDVDPVPTNDADESATTAAFIPEPDPNHVSEISPTSQTSVVGTDTKVSEKVRQPLENGKLSVTEKVSAAEKAVAAEKVIAANHLNESRPQEHHTSTEKAASNTQEDAPKKSFASIVNALKDNTVPFNERAPTVKPVEPPRASIRPASETPAPSSDTALEKKEDIAGSTNAIFVANFPMSTTVEQVEQVFKKFGSIKPNGIQVRSKLYQLSCFAFVEFESASSMQSALEASPITFDNRKLYIEQRRAPSNDRVRSSSGRGGNDNGRGRGNFSGFPNNFNGSAGYVRKDFEKRGEFSGRARGNDGRYGETMPRGNLDGGNVAQQAEGVQ